MRQRVLNERVVRVKIWSAAGTILYSDELRLIGSTFPLDPADANSLKTGVLAADLSDLTRPENRYERGYGHSSRSTSGSTRRASRRCCSRLTSGTRP